MTVEQRVPRPRRVTLRRVLLAVAGVVVLVGIYFVSRPPRFARHLISACAGADRVVVDFNTLPEPVRLRNSWPLLPSYEVRGRENAEALLRSIEVMSDPTWLIAPFSCRCYGAVALRFFRGDQQLAVVSYHHGTDLRWVDSEWRTDFPLTQVGREALESWISEQTGRPLPETLAEVTQQLDQWSEENTRRLQTAQSQPSATRPASMEGD